MLKILRNMYRVLLGVLGIQQPEIPSDVTSDNQCKCGRQKKSDCDNSEEK
jgi:hypothetical protein